jgi:hypothetical protein
VYPKAAAQPLASKTNGAKISQGRRHFKLLGDEELGTTGLREGKIQNLARENFFSAVEDKP